MIIHIIFDYRKNPIAYGSTYNSHPVALASAYAALKVLLRDGIVQNAGNANRPLSLFGQHFRVFYYLLPLRLFLMCFYFFYFCVVCRVTISL